MLLGADPVDLERLAVTHELCTSLLAGVRIRLRAVDRRSWTGPAARRWWSRMEGEVLPLLVRTGARSTAASRLLRERADAQRRASLADPQVAVLLEEARGDGRLVTLTGDPSAQVTVVLVPGVGTDHGDAARLAADAEQVWRYLAARAARAPARADVAVVSWLGYDPPDLVPLGLDRRPALAGAEDLVRQVAALRAEGAARVVVVGHSYGGLVASHASSLGMGADEVVLLGAPGLGVQDLAALRLPDGADLWAATARRDPIALVARLGLVHGPDPGDVALALPTSLDGHSSYLADPVLLGALAELVLADPIPSAHRRAQGQ